MINLQERRERKKRQQSGAQDLNQSGHMAPPPMATPLSGNRPDEAEHSVEPTTGVYLARRVAVVAAMVALVVIGAAAGRFVLSPEAPLTALAIPQSQPDALPETAPTTTPAPPTTIETTTTTTEVEVAADPYAVPDGASRLTPIDPERIIDSGESSGIGDRNVVELGKDWTAVALSVTVAGSPQAGSVLIDGGSGAVEAIAIDRAGASTTNLVIVPMSERTVSAWSTAGGRVIVDMVGGFETSGPTSAGRFVAIEPTEISRLVTKTDGRETNLPLEQAAPAQQASAYLVVITADVGEQGGMVRTGAGPDQYDQALMWGPATDVSNQRRGLVLMQPNSDGQAHLRYDGGSELSAQVVGYFTNESQPASTDGLYVASGPQRIHEGLLQPDEAVIVDGFDPSAATALVTVGSPSTGSSRLGTFLLPVGDGQTSLTPSSEIDSVITLLGFFIGGERR